MTSDLLTLKEAAAEYGMSASRMTRLVRRAGVPTHSNPLDGRSKIAFRDDIEAALHPNERPRNRLSSGQAIRIIRGEAPDDDLPPEGSQELRALMHRWIEGARRSRRMLAGRTLIPAIEALRIVRGEEHDDGVR